MALFRPDPTDAPRPRPSGNPAEQHTIIGAGTALDGSLRAQGNLNIAGTVQGDLDVQGRTMIMPGGRVDGAVVSTEAEIAGHVTGTVSVRERLVLRPTAVIDGDVRAAVLVIEDGAVFNGRCEMGTLATRADSSDVSAHLLDGSALPRGATATA